VSFSAEARVARQYDRWLTGPFVSGKGSTLLASLPGQILVNTPAFRLHEELQIRPDNRLLDIGCGRGAMLQLLSARVRFQSRPVGIDLSEAMLKLGKADSQATELVQGAGTSLPFSDESFHVVTCAHVVKHLDDDGVLRLLKEVRRVLTYGGIALLWELAPTRSSLLNRWNERVVTFGVKECNFRGYANLSAYALEAGFDWVANARMRPFLFPPIPRVSLILGKAPADWTPEVPSQIS
jgi:SAM-dependent methyltransferase